ncbi:MAG: hypothetical protein FJ135_10720 [Deltaproteobacteria bacterium]|nr:hypothetical protein [Deltaproteobacteria bacterium]
MLHYKGFVQHLKEVVEVLRQEARLAVVHTLSQAILEIWEPDQLPIFEQEFNLWASHPSSPVVREHLEGEETGGVNLTLSQPSRVVGSGSLAAPSHQGLDATLVAGMFFQVLLEAEHLPGNPLERTNFVKKAVKNFLVQRLAGQITLSQFFRLVQIIEPEVTYYFHRLQGEWLSPQDTPSRQTSPPETTYAVAPTSPVLRDLLRRALSRLPLPHQANRKLSPEGLLDFLVRTEGNWFRLLDFEFHFGLNKKTAWTYLALLLQHDILRHNEQKANKVRYALSLEFMAPIAAPGH